LRHRFKCEDSEIGSELEHCRKRGEPVFALIQPPPPAPEDVRALRNEFPTVCFVVLAGETINNKMRSVFDGIVILEPYIGKDVENSNLVGYTTARNALIRFFESEPG